MSATPLLVIVMLSIVLMGTSLRTPTLAGLPAKGDVPTPPRVSATVTPIQRDLAFANVPWGTVPAGTTERVG